MKKIIVAISFIILLVMIPKMDAEASTNNYIFIGVNDELIFMDVPAYLEKGTTYVPIRTFAHLGVKIIWNGEERSVYIEEGERHGTIYVDSNLFITDENEQLEMNSKIINGNTMIPYRAITEYFGYDVSFIPDGPIARVLDNREIEETNEKLSDKEFLTIHKNVIDKKKEELRKLEEQKKQQSKPKKVAYLTFDDGPNNNTATILNILKKYDAKATFFVLEPNVKRYPADMKRKVQEGHTLACHGVTHNKNIVYRNAQSVVNEMSQCKATVKNITGVSTNLVRVPYGSVPHMKAPYRAAMKNAGFKMWDWNVDTLDWKYNSNQVVNHTIQQVNKLERQGIAPVILLHNLQSSTNALERIIVDLKNRGYKLVALTEEMTAYDFHDKNMQSIKLK